MNYRYLFYANSFRGCPQATQGAGLSAASPRHSFLVAVGFPLQSLTRQPDTGYQLQVAGLLKFKRLIICLNNEVQKLINSLPVAGCHTVDMVS